MTKSGLNLMISAIIFGLAATAQAQRFWTYVVIETAVSRAAADPDGDDPEERRFYVSNVVALPDDIADYHTKKTADDYFTKNIVEPLQAKGILHEYYDDGVQVNCGSVVAIKDRQDAEAKRTECFADLKEQGRVNIYAFTWTFSAAKGLATSKPTLLFRGPDTPHYEPKNTR